jgi:hypothetical protein
MSPFSAFALSAAISLGLAVLTILLLHRSLGALLLEVCGSAGRARFWSSFSSIVVVLHAWLGMLVSFPISAAKAGADVPALATVFGAFRISLVFLLFGLGVLGFALLIGISNYEHRRTRELIGWRVAPPPPAQT